MIAAARDCLHFCMPSCFLAMCPKSLHLPIPSKKPTSVLAAEAATCSCRSSAEAVSCCAFTVAEEHKHDWLGHGKNAAGVKPPTGRG